MRTRAGRTWVCKRPLKGKSRGVGKGIKTSLRGEDENGLRAEWIDQRGEGSRLSFIVIIKVKVPQGRGRKEGKQGGGEGGGDLGIMRG